MYLHKDKETFKEIIEQVADDTGCAAVVIEKDYLHIPQELRIRSGGTERHSASN